MLCSPHAGPCPCAVLSIASKSQRFTHLEAGCDPFDLGTAGLGTWSRMVSSHGEILHRIHHLLRGVSQPLCLGKRNARGIEKHLGVVPESRVRGWCSPQPLASAVSPGFGIPAAASGPADCARVRRWLHRRLLSCSVPWPGASTGMLTFFCG